MINFNKLQAKKFWKNGLALPWETYQVYNKKKLIIIESGSGDISGLSSFTSQKSNLEKPSFESCEHPLGSKWFWSVTNSSLMHLSPMLALVVLFTGFMHKQIVIACAKSRCQTHFNHVNCTFVYRWHKIHKCPQLCFNCFVLIKRTYFARRCIIIIIISSALAMGSNYTECFNIWHIQTRALSWACKVARLNDGCAGMWRLSCRGHIERL